MINYKCFGKAGPCLFVAESIGKDGETYYLKDHTVSEDYRNGRLDAVRSIMGQFDMEDDYDAGKGSYKAMKIKAGVDNA